MARKKLYAMDNAPVFDLYNGPEKHFLLDLIEQEGPGALDEHPIPELYALLRAIERMWGGADAKQLTVPPELIYYLAVSAAYVHHIPDDVIKQISGCNPFTTITWVALPFVHPVAHILGFQA